MPSTFGSSSTGSGPGGPPLLFHLGPSDAITANMNNNNNNNSNAVTTATQSSQTQVVTPLGPLTTVVASSSSSTANASSSAANDSTSTDSTSHPKYLNGESVHNTGCSSLILSLYPPLTATTALVDDSSHLFLDSL